MLSNFHLAALTKAGDRIELLYIPLHQSLQDLLAETWGEQFDDFTDEIDEVDFNAGYKPEEHERFCIRDYELPNEFDSITSLTIQNEDTINAHEDLVASIKAIVGFARNADSEELVLFQNFIPSQVIRPGRFLFLDNDTYVSSQRPGMTLANKLSSVYPQEDRKLLFQNFRITNTFLPLAEYYEEASEEEIQSILSHDLLAAEDAEAIARTSNQWFRKRFAMLRDSHILDNYSAQQIRDHSIGYNVDIQIDNDKIVFPKDKVEAKRLLQFLNEELYRGAITETLYETNSKRAAQQ